jgi:UDP-3-O-acyl-N-acetylglucosamine deacetylase
VGDLALLGHPLLGRLEAVKAGHELHAAVAQKLLDSPEAFDLVESPFRAGLDREGPGRPATGWTPARA